MMEQRLGVSQKHIGITTEDFVPGKRARKVTLGHMFVHKFASCIHISIFKTSLEDSYFNWVMLLEHSNVPVKTCSLGKEVVEM